METCSCNCPCSCDGSEASTPSIASTPTTKCDLLAPGQKNLWREGEPGYPGVCLLDTMQEFQVIWVLTRMAAARLDLLLATSDPRLRQLAGEIDPLPQHTESDRLQALINQPNNPASIPQYTQFRGKL